MTYEQPKYMNGDEKANASFAPKPSETTQLQTTNEQEPAIQITQEPKKGVIDTVKGGLNKGNKETLPQSDTTTTQEQSQSQTTSYLPETMGDKEKSLYQNVASNDVDSDTKLQEQGQGKKEAIESVVPRYDKKTWKSLMSDPNLSWDQKAELVLNGLGGALSAGDTGQVQQTDKNRINDEITQQYAQNIADRDKRAMNAQIEPLEALNKQQTDLELRMRDTVAGAYIDRYKAAQDATTKQEVLKQLVDDSTVWTSLTPKQKIDMLSYIQALDGNGSLLGMAIQMWAPKLFNKFDEWIKGGNNPKDFKIEEGAETRNFTIEEGAETRNFTTVGAYEIPDDVLTNPDRNKDYVAIPVGGNKPPLVVRKGSSYGVTGPLFKKDIQRFNEENEAAYEAIMGNDALTPEQKIALAREVDGLTGKNEFVYQAQNGVERRVRDALGVGALGKPKPDVSPVEQKARKANAQTVQTEINNIQSQVTSGSMTPSDAIKKLDALASKMGNMDDGTGLIALKAQNLMRDCVMQDIKGYVESNARNPLKDASTSLRMLEKMVQQYGDKIAQDPKLREKVNNMYTKYRYQENYIDPFMKGVGQDVYKTRRTSGVPGDSWSIGSDGQIWDMDPYNLSGKYKPIDFATYQWDTNKNAKANAIIALTSVYDKANPETVKKNMGSVPIEGQGEVFRETPIFKFMENLVKDENFKNKAYAVDKSGAFIHPDMKSMYDKIKGRYLMWKNK